ncbi:hypothetical protein [Brasilonema bromeliae]|nr:hypothetical protein [Brasilonema bromeliae]
MQIVAGISLKGIKPRAWDKNSPYYLPQLRALRDRLRRSHVSKK